MDESFKFHVYTQTLFLSIQFFDFTIAKNLYQKKKKITLILYRIKVSRAITILIYGPVRPIEMHTYFDLFDKMAMFGATRNPVLWAYVAK